MNCYYCHTELQKPITYYVDIKTTSPPGSLEELARHPICSNCLRRFYILYGCVTTYLEDK